ncbi:MAG: universal stress protein [Halobacteriales archaeon]|nr:universal stress protein [Halobacteriales archaeon]
MADKVLVPVDRSEQARKAFDWAVEEFDDSHLVLLHVIEPLNVRFLEKSEMEGKRLSIDERYEKVLDETEAFLSRLVDEAEESGVEASYDYIDGKPSQRIVEYAEEENVDHIVVGSHGRSGVARVLLGSVAEKVARRSPVPVTVVR